MRERRAVARQQVIHVIFEPAHEIHVGNRPIFDDLGQASAEFALWQRIQRGKVTHHQLRLVERTNHVLAQRVVDGRLASHRRIHLRQ